MRTYRLATVLSLVGLLSVLAVGFHAHEAAEEEGHEHSFCALCVAGNASKTFDAAKVTVASFAIETPCTFDAPAVEPSRPRSNVLVQPGAPRAPPSLSFNA